MLKKRVIPCLLLHNNSLVKTIKFNQFNYIGDPVNTVRIFNELEVDEICFLDIQCSKEKKLISFDILKKIANECFMPLSYGGGIDSLEKAQEIFNIGFEKVVINSAIYNNSNMVKQIVEIYGSQSVIGSIDVKKNLFGKYIVYSHSSSINQKKTVIDWVKEVEQMGVGEILLTNVDNEGTWSGFDEKLIAEISQAISVPLIAHGGAGNIEHIGKAAHAGASAICVGSMVVYQKKGMGVLIHFPDKKKIEQAIK